MTATDNMTVALVGNPNSGKTTLFNALTGRDQRVGNWPGVTVERKEGRVKLGGEGVHVVDLPGIYALLASSEDERVARDYILSGEPGLVVDIVDATNLERNLFLTTQLLDMRIPVVIVLTMMDLAQSQGIAVDVDALSARLGCPVVGINATDKRDTRKALTTIADAWAHRRISDVPVGQPAVIEELATTWSERLEGIAGQLGTNSRWFALKLLERDAWSIGKVVKTGAMSVDEIEHAVSGVEEVLGESADMAIAESRYGFIESVTRASLKRPPVIVTGSDKADRVFLNRYLGIPIFLGVMYLLFWFTINVGGAFIDFFDIAGGTIFVDGFRWVLEAVGSPEWLVVILADAIGAGLQTMATFIPVIFTMFLGLSLLEESGYMARAAFVMDRSMRWVGLPGKSFVPMLVGFGCNVPAIMATRTLDNKRDRYLTLFMNPFMSCGARLPVYALFGAIFFGAAAGMMILSLYVVGIVAAVLTGLLLKSTMFRGEPAYFVMELPSYHRPRLGRMLSQAWRRLLVFMTRAKYIMPVIAVVAILNSVGTDGTLGNEDTPKSVLSQIGRTITPVFEPMGVEEENWPASVGIFTGLMAKEAVVGTLNALYSQEEAAVGEGAPAEEAPAEEEGFSLAPGLREAWDTIPAGLAGVPATFIDPLGLGFVGGSEEEVAEEVGASTTMFARMRAGFTEGRPQVYAYLLFVLLYLPCVAAFGALTKEMGIRYTLLALTYLAVTSWSVATLFYQFTVERNPLLIVLPLALMALMAFVFWVIGKRSDPLETGRLKPAAQTTASC